MDSIPGIKSILLCQAGTLATTPVKPIYVGVGKKSAMKITPFKTTKDSKNRQSRNMLMVQVDFESTQVPLKTLITLMGFINLGADVQVITDKQAFAADSEDVFKFTAATFQLGLSFEYIINLESRSIKGTLKGAAPYNTVKALIDSADSEAAVTVSGITQPGGEDFSQVRGIDIAALQCPLTTDLYASGSLDDFKLSIKTKTSENAFGQTFVDAYTNHLEATIKDASVTNLLVHLNKAIDAPVLLKLNNAGSYYDALDFNTGAMAPSHEPEISDDKRNLKVTFEGDVRPFEYALETGVAKGGAAADEGLNGGTLKIGY